MNRPEWCETDFRRAEVYLEEHEAEQPDTALFDCGDGLHAIIPRGLPALGVRFYGLFMLAPLPVLMASVLLLVLYGFQEEIALNLTTLAVFAVCLVLIAGLARVMHLILKNRALFPRDYFVTLGKNGIAMHYSRKHFPFHNPRAWLTWHDVQSVTSGGGFFLPAFFLGLPFINYPRVLGENGTVVDIPFRLSRAKQPLQMEAIEALIQQNLQWRKTIRS
ncbi:hypothetical protein [Nitrospina watsonii]|uniref:DUF304 domain-containing protein n=1 Tax=Nitrospina watsonii TaxID=1323948 RepID=A0ABM9HFH5_9BACT|nr:hypothetical protein [Nitrospina watsonii]CAI2718788.1 conserved protein of unknown function [Nitrospina watsonii]